MPSVASFNLVPETPYSPEDLDALRARLSTYPTYHDAEDDLYVLFGSPEEQRETVALYSRKTTPTFDVECFVQLRREKLLVHPGGERGGMENLRDFVAWVLETHPHRLTRGGGEIPLDQALPPIADLRL
jgi:hypothetical protein